MGLSSTVPPGALTEPAAFGIQTKKFVMWLFIIADAATFGAILFGYGYLRYASPNWPKPFAFSPQIINGLVMTVVLLTSSLTMLFAVAAAQANDRQRTVRWIGATIVLGVIFAALHLHEWFDMFAEGWSLSHDPIGGSALFGGAFFSITGLHLLHVITGVVALARSTRCRLRRDHRALLALRRSRLDVRVSVGLSVERSLGHETW
jgi:cytochrome c oxidase subunit 3